MALKIFEKFSPRANPADADYPYGSIKNESVPGAKDGTPLDASWGNDMLGFTDALLDEAGITPNGLPDTVGSSQRLDALKTVVRKHLELKIFQSPTNGGLTEIQTRTVEANEVYEVRKTSNDSLATIYSDAAGTTEIVQDGINNKSGSDGIVEFYVAYGDYYIAVGAKSTGFTVTNTRVFNSVAAMLAFNGLVEGQHLEWRGYYEPNDGGGNTGVVRLGTHTHDGGSIFSVDANIYIEAAMSDGIVNVKKFGAKGNAFSESFEISSGGKPYNELRQLNAQGWDDDSDAIQSAIDYALKIPMFSPIVFIPNGGFAITKPILINHADGLTIQGCGRMSSCLVPVGDMTPVLNDAFIYEQELQDVEFPPSIGDGVNYDTEKAVFMVASGRRTLSSSFSKQYNRAQWMLTFRDMGMSGFASNELCSFIYGSEFAHSYLSNIYVEYGHCLLKAWDMYRLKITQCDVQSSYTPIDHYSPKSEENSDGTGSSTGTSVHFDACGAATVTKGWFLRHLSYSSMTCCTIDGWGWQPDGVYDPDDTEIKYAYTIERCVGFTMTSCGCESARPSTLLNSAAFNIYGADEGQMNIIGGTYLQEFRDDFSGRPNIFSGLDLSISGPLLSSGGSWLIKRGQLHLGAISYDLPVGFFECEDWVLRKPGDSNTVTRFNPTIVTSGRHKAAIARYNLTSTDLPSAGGFVTFDSGDSDTGYEEYDWGIFDEGGDTLVVPFSGWFFLSCTISYTGINSTSMDASLTRTDGTTQTLAQIRLPVTTDAAGDTTISCSARFNKGDKIRIGTGHTGDGGFITRVSTSFFQI